MARQVQRIRTALDGTDNWDQRVCKMFFSGNCEAGSSCPLKHTFPIREVVCRFLLMNNTCSKGSLCPFLHEIIEDKIPECRKFMSEGACNILNCKFKHSSEKREQKECTWYNMGFCENGKKCKYKHAKKELCVPFMETGKCMLGEACPKAHIDSVDEAFLEDAYYKFHPNASVVNYSQFFEYCFRCNCFGHLPVQCPSPDDSKTKDVRCFRCCAFGHKSNNCLYS